MLNQELELSLNMAFARAREHRHEFMTVEHLLLALLSNPSAREALEAWRDARRTAWQTTVKVITTGILAALLVGAAIKLKLMGGVQ